MAGVTIKVDGSKARLSSPFHPVLPKRARELGGKWDATAKQWVFDARDEERVRALCREIYGTDGNSAGETVIVRVKLDDLPDAREQSLWLCGRQVASRYNRDSMVKIGDNVVVISGGFPSSGGSVKHPSLRPYEGTVLEIRGVPAGIAQETAAKYPTAVEILREEKEDVEALLKRKEELLKELADIEARLTKAGRA